MYIRCDLADFGRIDIYVSGKYRCSTVGATLSEARQRYIDMNPEVVPEVVAAQYSDAETPKENERRRRLRMWI